MFKPEWEAISRATKIALVSHNGDILKASPAFASLLGYSVEQLEKLNYQRLTHPDDLDKDVTLHQKLVQGELEQYELEKRYIHKEGFIVWVKLCVGMVWKNQEPQYAIATITDITKQKEREETLLYLSTHDQLTGLYNRAYFTEALKTTVAKCQRYGCHEYLLYLDLNKFKPINDEYGHHIGDYTLRVLSHRLTRLLRSSDITARLGGDEFAILISEVEPDEVDALARRILQSIEKPLLYTGDNLSLSIEVSAAIGICNLDCGADPEVCLISAERAMRQAKRSDTPIIQARPYEQTRRDLQLERDIRQAVQAKEFTVYYQPIRDLTTLELVGHEALLRWPNQQNITPPTILELAEIMGLAQQVEWQVIQKTIQDINPDTHHWVSINVESLLRQKHFKVKLLDLLNESETPLSRISVEVMESIRRNDPAIQLLIDLQQSGVDLKLDDFGQDHAGFGWIRDLPLSAVKIDRRFIHGVASSPRQQALVIAMISACHGIELNGRHITVIAEGIERDDDLEWLKYAGCDQGQGFHPSLGRPEPKLRVS